MKQNDIIQKFNEDETKFAKEAVLEAKKKKGKINDCLLEHLKEFASNIKDYKDKESPLSIVYCIYLLAEFEDKRLFPILIEIFENKDYQDNTLGDCIIDRLDSIIVSVFDGDFKSLNNIIENKNIDDYVRSQILRCYIYFYDNNILNKEDIEKYLLKLIKLYNYQYDPIYDSILDVIVNIHLFSMIEEVKNLFERGVIDLMLRGDYDDFIDDIFNYDDNLNKISKIEDTVEEMSWWALFDNDDLDTEKTSEAINKMINNDLNSLITTKVGRNDPCPCGSGKKYKKCCIDKEELMLPYQSFIDKSLSEYPKKKNNKEKYDIYDFYKEEYIEIDKLLYKIFKHKRIPIYIERNYDKEDKIKLIYFKEAFEKIKDLLKKEKFKTIEEYDKKVSIHYSLYRFYQEYSHLLIGVINKSINTNKNIYISALKELVDFFYSNFDINNDNEIFFLNAKHALYCLEKKYDDGIKFFQNKLNNSKPSIKYDIYDCLFDLYMCKYDDITKIDELISKEKDKDLQKELEELKLEFFD